MPCDHVLLTSKLSPSVRGKMRKFISGGIEGAEGEEIAPKNFKSQAMPEKAL